jgi:hypothetical protein
MTHPEVEAHYKYHGSRPEALAKRVLRSGELDTVRDNRANSSGPIFSHSSPTITDTRTLGTRSNGFSIATTMTNEGVNSNSNRTGNDGDGTAEMIRKTQHTSDKADASTIGTSLFVGSDESDTDEEDEKALEHCTTPSKGLHTVSEVADVKSKKRGEGLITPAIAQENAPGVEAPPMPVEEPDISQGIGSVPSMNHRHDLGEARDPPPGGNLDEDLQDDVPINQVPVANMLPLVAPVYRNIGREEVLQNRILLLEQQMVNMQRFHLASTQLQQMQAFQTQTELLNTKQELINTKRELENTKGVLKHEQRKSRRLELASLPPLMPSQDPNTGNKRPRTQ